MLQHVDGFGGGSGREIFGGRRHAGEASTPRRQMFGQIAFVLSILVYMSAMLTLLANFLAH